MHSAAADVNIREKWLTIVLIGAVTGILSGLLGIGGAAILVPSMVDLLGVSQHRASGTSLFVIVPTAAVAAVVYALDEQMDWALVLIFSVTAVLGATLGARAMTRISAANLRRMFGAFLLLIAIRLLIPGGTAPDAPVPDHVFTQSPAITAGEGLLGFIAGFLSGLLGIGGGQVLTPGMIFLFNIPQKLAQGISIAFIVPTAISGAYTHYRRGNVMPRLGMVLMPCSMIGGIVGALLAQSIDATYLRTGFGIFLIYGSARMLAPNAVNRIFRRLAGARS